jgi:predicted acylesterase/phospholipase RssA
VVGEIVKHDTTHAGSATKSFQIDANFFRIRPHRQPSDFHLIYHAKTYEGIAKDYEFSRRTMEEHWHAGDDDDVRTLSHPEVLQRPDKIDGVRTFDFRKSDR